MGKWPEGQTQTYCTPTLRAARKSTTHYTTDTTLLTPHYTAPHYITLHYNTLHYTTSTLN
jgi:hypothetical protein